MEEGLLVDFLGAVGMADEDDLDMPVAAGEKHVEQHVEPLGEVFHVLGHRARHVHQAEHHRLRYRLRHRVEAAVADVDRVDEGNALGLGLERLDLGEKLSAARLVRAGLELHLELGDRLRPRPPQGNAARHRELHRAAHRDIGRRTRGRIAGALKPLAFGFGELALGEIRQFEIVEEQVDEFVARQHEAEIVLAVALARLPNLGHRRPSGAR